MNNNLILESSYIIQLPFPPEITAKDFINRRNPDRFSAKGPNAFFIFRKEIVSYLKKNNLKFKMQEVSAIAGRSWKESPPHVKTTYKLIAEEVEILLNKVRNKLNYATERMNMFPIIQHQFVDLSSQTQFYEQNLYTPEFEYESINSESIIDENTVEENINPPVFLENFDLDYLGYFYFNFQKENNENIENSELDIIYEWGDMINN